MSISFRRLQDIIGVEDGFAEGVVESCGSGASGREDEMSSGRLEIEIWARLSLPIDSKNGAVRQKYGRLLEITSLGKI